MSKSKLVTRHIVVVCVRVVGIRQIWEIVVIIGIVVGVGEALNILIGTRNVLVGGRMAVWYSTHNRGTQEKPGIGVKPGINPGSGCE